MKLIVGLGNPGDMYAATRHNFGFMALDRIADTFAAPFCEQSKFKAATAEIYAHGEKFVLVKPLTFMNLSGDAVSAFANFYKVAPECVWVIADDLDLPLGKIRVRSGGEAGGHHGLEDIIKKLSSRDFWRIRLGIRGESARHEHLNNQIATNDFVLQSFQEQEHKFVEATLQEVTLILKKGIEEKKLMPHTYEVDGYDSHAGDATDK